MKILFANIIYPTPARPEIVGGAEVSVKALAETLAQQGHTVAVVRGHEPESHDSRETANGVTVYSLGIRNYYWPFDNKERGRIQKAIWHAIDDIGSAPIGFGKILDEFRPDAVHTNNLLGLTFGVWKEAAKRKIPVMHVIRDYYLMCARSTRFRNDAICNRKCGECYATTINRSKATNLVSAVSGNSRAILDTHLEAGLFAYSKVKVNIANIAEPKNVSRNRVPTLRFGFIGRSAVEKGIQLLASAFGKIEGDCELVIASDVPADQRTELERLAGRPIRFLGFVREPGEFYSQVDVVVVPSLWAEPLPRAALEAQSYGLPVIGSTRGGIPEAIGNTGAGWLFDPADDANLAAIMQELHDQRQTLIDASIAAKERAQEFSRENIAGAHLSVLSEIAKHAATGDQSRVASSEAR